MPHYAPRARAARNLAFMSLLTFAACGGESAFSAHPGGGGNRDASSDAGSGGAGMGGNGGSGGVGIGGMSAMGGSGGAGTGGSGTGGAFDGGTDGPSDGPRDTVVNPDGAVNGTACTTNSQCANDHCVDKVCCESACTGTCYTCASTASPGMCVPAAADTDPRNECDDMGVATCKTTGVCNGSGACRLYANGEICDSTPACNATNSVVVNNSQCNGNGACVPAMTQDCKGFLCSAATCGTSCAGDSDCVTGAFCSAGACVVPPVNLAGNGDLELGTTLGWGPFGGASSVNLSNTASSGVSHGGQYSVGMTARSQPYQGPSYNMPTGIGKYNITGFGMQQTDPTLTGILQIAVTCYSTSNYVTIQSSGFGIPMPMSSWTQFFGPVDFSTLPADCQPAASPPGVVRLAQIYLNQSGSGTPTALPDLFMDDVVIQTNDGHNLVGNYNFEATVTVGWVVSGSATLSVSATVASGGTHSLMASGRSTTASGPSYTLPLGAAKYNVSFRAYHNGTSSHTLSLQPTYTCSGGSVAQGLPITGNAMAGGTWATISGTMVLPPPNAPAGCKLVQAEVHVQQESGTCGTVECPDLYVDDVSISSATPYRRARSTVRRAGLRHAGRTRLWGAGRRAPAWSRLPDAHRLTATG